MDWDKLKERGMGENPEQKTERERRREVKTPLLKGREVRTKKKKKKKE